MTHETTLTLEGDTIIGRLAETDKRVNDLAVRTERFMVRLHGARPKPDNPKGPTMIKGIGGFKGDVHDQIENINQCISRIADALTELESF